jgi:hypothetical protein
MLFCMNLALARKKTMMQIRGKWPMPVALWSEDFLGGGMMHIETRLNQRTDAVRHETRVAREAHSLPQHAGNMSAVADGCPASASVWGHVVNALLAGECHEAEGAAFVKIPVRRIPADTTSRHVQIEVIERLTESSIAVLWQDATRCRYLDQVWISCRARLKGRCALSGATIRRDDLIYKPRVRSAIPANAGAMILASVIARMPFMQNI